MEGVPQLGVRLKPGKRKFPRSLCHIGIRPRSKLIVDLSMNNPGPRQGSCVDTSGLISARLPREVSCQESGDEPAAN